jgi:arsenate reductase
LTLFPSIAANLETLERRPADFSDVRDRTLDQLATWVADETKEGRTVQIIFVCTGNSRRSILGSTLGNIAAARYGFSNVRCFSGGTEPTAFNARTIVTLQDIGVQIFPLGQLAPAGIFGELNPIYRVRWGDSELAETTEFSKRFDDSANPQAGFLAIMVCDEAAENCPVVRGARLRIALPFDDPKVADGQKEERATYASRRDEIGRTMLEIFRRASSNRERR